MVIKLIIADYDGTLIDLRDIHFEALNKALSSIDEKFVISQEEHIKTFDGLSTKNKLKMLSSLKGFPIDKADEVNALKQIFTVELLNKFEKINHDIVNVVSKLKEEGFTFFVASNAIKNTIEIGLKKLGIYHLVDKIYSNQDVVNSKPNPEMYFKCMADAGVSPFETIIIEDSKHGREAAIKSGAYVCGVDDSFDFTYSRIKKIINLVKPTPIKWAGKSDLTILIPMAGAGSRFTNAGFKLPKPLIDVNGKPMIQRVVENLNVDGKFIFVVQKYHFEHYNLGTILPLIAPNCQIIQTEGLTEGAACTTLLAKEFINNDNHLLIANSDQIVEWDSCDFMHTMLYDKVDGGILTFKDITKNPKWSFAKTNDLGYVTEVAEKRPISDQATVGIYYFNRGSEYVKYAEQMIQENIRVNNEFYVCPIYNEYIKNRKKIKSKDCNRMWGIGTPEDLNHFIENYE